MTAKFDGSSGAWPTPRGPKRITNADIVAAQQECPRVFEAEVRAADAFLAFLPLTPIVIAPGMSADEIRVASFRAMGDLEREIFGDPNAIPVEEVRDE